jgi:hypothetical protein
VIKSEQSKPDTRRWFEKKRVIFPLTLVVIVLVSLAIQATKTPNVAETPSHVHVVAGKRAEIGQTVTVGNFAFLVEGVKCRYDQVGTGKNARKAKGHFCLVNFQVRNIGNTTGTFTTMGQVVYDQDGKEYAPDVIAMLVHSQSNFTVSAEVTPGSTQSGTLVYDLPASADPVYITFHDAVLGKGVEVSLKYLPD